MHALTGVYALDAIDGAERERFEHHLSRCQPCDNEVRGLQETATRLATGGRGRAAARAEGARADSAVATTRQLPPVPDVTPAAQRAADAGWARRLAVPLAAACLVAVDRARRPARHVAESARQRADRRSSRHRGRAERARRQAGERPTSLGGTATVVVASQLHEFVFTSAGLPALPTSRVYQLWIMRPGGSATSPACWPRPANGSTAPVLASGLAHGDQVGVTVEPAGGAD